MKGITKQIDRNVILLLVAVALLILVVIIHGSLSETNKIDESIAVNEVITETIEESSNTGEENGAKLVESTNNVMKASVYADIDPYEIIKADIEALKNKDVNTINRYFGESTVFTPETIADRLTATVVSFVSSNYTEENTEVIIHVCTLDYIKMNEAAKEIKDNLIADEESKTEIDIDNETNKEVAKGVVSGEFDLHYNIPVKIKDGAVVITEELKQALTGNWYAGVGITLKSVDCPIKTN